MTDYKKQLIELYENKSKHSNYQILPNKIKSIINPEDINTKTRSEYARLKYMTDEMDFTGKTVLDIGANSGYFSFELLDAGASSVHYYEGNSEHAEFVGLAAKVLGLEGKMRITNDYFQFDGSDNGHYDVCLLLNVLHHVGDDYGDNTMAIENAKQQIIRQLNGMNKVADTLVFQLGFNWKGDTKHCLFENGTKREMIDFIREGVKNDWDIDSIAIAVRDGEEITYKPLDDQNIERDDSMGEFLNRPLFILKSKRS